MEKEKKQSLFFSKFLNLYNMKKKYFLVILFVGVLAFFSTRHTINGHGILTSNNLDPRVWAQMGTTGDSCSCGCSGCSCGGSGCQGGGSTPTIQYEYVECFEDAEKNKYKYFWDEKTAIQCKRGDKFPPCGATFDIEQHAKLELNFMCSRPK